MDQTFVWKELSFDATLDLVTPPEPPKFGFVAKCPQLQWANIRLVQHNYIRIPYHVIHAVVHKRPGTVALCLEVLEIIPAHVPAKLNVTNCFAGILSIMTIDILHKLKLKLKRVKLWLHVQFLHAVILGARWSTVLKQEKPTNCGTKAADMLANV